MTDPAGPGLGFARALAILAEGKAILEGRLPWSSNATWLVRLETPEARVLAVYKPRRGERPLWDFPAGTLCLREMAAFELSQALGWGLVPPTVLRQGPLGLGALQLFIPHDPEEHFLVLERPDPATVARLVAFDVIINNADRKSGHVLRDETGRLWAIDHGIAFHAEPKLRTVVWELAGEPLPADLAADLSALLDALDPPASDEAASDEPASHEPAADEAAPGLAARLAPLLSPAEIAALVRRGRRLLARGRFPGADPGRRDIPWPPV